MNIDQAKEAQDLGSLVSFKKDGIEYVGTIIDWVYGSAELDVIAYQSDKEWRSKELGLEWVPIEDLRMYQRNPKTADVQEDSDQVVKLFGVGDLVETPEGPGEVVAVQFNAAKYHDGWELDPPSLIVELEDGQTIHTCLCSIELPHTVKGTKLIHKEFDRLWPPKVEDVPPDADMLIPEGDEKTSSQKKGSTIMKRHKKYRKPNYRKADAVLSRDEVLMVVNEAIEAMNGERTGINQGEPGDIDVDGSGDYYSEEVVVKVADLHTGGGMAEALSWSNIQWGGWVEIGYHNEDPNDLEVHASGILAFDGQWKDKNARIGGEYDVINGTYDIDTGEWEWYADTM